VKAEDLGTRKAQHITITAKNKLNKEEIERFVKEAEKFSDEDKKQKTKIEAKNEGDSILYATEKALREHGGKVSQEERSSIERAVSDLKEALKSEDPERITKSAEAVRQAAQKLGEAIYRDAAKPGASAGPEAAAGGASAAPNGKDQEGAKKKGSDEVVDAEVVEDEKP
ncbi:MAG TPA: molecular chaperone DnaK, partial [Elusimicrobia bacterium]|nr:molecular chaperone DnaK [Elusimicrobiota bacterium]